MNHQQGFTLIEVLVTISVIAIGVMALIALMLSIFRVNQQADTKTQAIQLAQREFDDLKREALTTIPVTGKTEENVTYNNRAFTIRQEYCVTTSFCASNQKSVRLSILSGTTVLFMGETVLTDLRAK
ncbi:type IV pilus modification PilV family protein [Deinococcus sedimenti]|uniref:Prepilin-type N-terminal cleavage/methylation domain-containing protein n=1 Tax=Deinococcus sedimenti TaxID=1867090 RepID=A0ABQ2S968_9DEIO|nr:prepilin-type N-terminal cleavage/methylation domain-containing protein [Deinococcus sedimenti]GGS10263.1 hypothetical protein GCM10008960_40500 [Deinococcus sedimenti]